MATDQKTTTLPATDLGRTTVNVPPRDRNGEAKKAFALLETTRKAIEKRGLSSAWQNWLAESLKVEETGA